MMFFGFCFYHCDFVCFTFLLADLRYEPVFLVISMSVISTSFYGLDVSTELDNFINLIGTSSLLLFKQLRFQLL